MTNRWYMGWSSGSELAENLWWEIEKYIPESEKSTVAANICDMFANRDCDTLPECADLWGWAVKNLKFIAGNIYYSGLDTREKIVEEIHTILYGEYDETRELPFTDKEIDEICSIYWEQINK
jgi:hypothetical protein